MSPRLSRHREALKWELVSRDEFCPGCGRPLFIGRNMQLHEAIISRAQMMGLPTDAKIELHCKFNCVLLCYHCNVYRPPARERMWKRLCAIYGKAQMETWYEKARSLFKSPPGWPAQVLDRS